MEKVYTLRQKTFFPLYRQLAFLLAGNQFIFCEEEVVATYV